MLRKFKYSFTTVFSRMLFGTVITLLCAKVLGPADFGKIAVLMALGSLVISFVDCGFTLQITKKIAEENLTLHSIDVGASFYFKLFLIIPFVLLYCLLKYNTGMEVVAALLFLLSFVLVHLNILNGSLYRAQGDYNVESWKGIKFNTFSLFIVVPVLYMESVTCLMIAFALGRFLAHYFTFDLKLHPKISKAGMLESIEVTKNGMSFFFSSLLGSLYFTLDVIIIDNLVPYSDLGMYRFLVIISLGACMLTSVFNNVLFVEYSKVNPNYKVHLVFSGLIGLAVSIISLLVFPYIISILFGEEYQPAIEFIPIISVAIIFRYLSVVPSVFIVVKRGAKVRVVFATINMLIQISILIPLTASFGLYGAVVSFMVCSITLFMMYALYSAKYILNST